MNPKKYGIKKKYIYILAFSIVLIAYIYVYISFVLYKVNINRKLLASFNNFTCMTKKNNFA